MKLSSTEKRIYALAQKWAKAKGQHGWHWGKWYDTHEKAKSKRACGRALLKLFQKAG